MAAWPSLCAMVEVIELAFLAASARCVWHLFYDDLYVVPAVSFNTAASRVDQLFSWRTKFGGLRLSGDL